MLTLVGVVALAGYLATLPAIASRTSRRVGAAPSDLAVAAQVVSFRSRDGILLKGWWMPAVGVARATVILAHGRDGNRSFMVSRAKFLIAHGYNAFPIDLRGHGESEGRYMTPGYLEALDILGAVDAAKGRGVPGPFVTLGHSSGAVAALQAAARSPELVAVIADGAFLSVDSVLGRAAVIVARDAKAPLTEKVGLAMASRLSHTSWGRTFADWAFYLRTGVRIEPHAVDALPAIARIGVRPTMFIVGEQDGIATPTDARLMFDAALSPKKALLIVPGAGHNTTYAVAPTLYEARVIAFLTAALGRASSH